MGRPCLGGEEGEPGAGPEGRREQEGETPLTRD